MDGFSVAKNLQSLADERERLSVDLADKTDELKNLMQKNQWLKHQI